MVKESFIKILNNPEEIDNTKTTDLSVVVKGYPYFQSARALYLKALKNEDSFKYNNELKKTAAYTTDRTVLFDFITSISFNKNKFNKTADTPSTLKEEKTNIKEQVQEELKIGKPLSFTRNETFSFNQWLKLSNDAEIFIKPKNESKSLQENIIDSFIAKSPKISKVNKNAPLNSKTKQQVQDPLPMTETLAKIYLEQKKYDNAIKAYEILSLKYPEKSGFFADQIKKIRILQKS